MVETVLGMTDLQIKLFTALGQIGVAVAVGYVAYRQWRTAQQQASTARKKLQLDLFDRRLAVYEAVRSVAYRSITSDWRANVELEMASHLAELRWLFGETVRDFVWNELYLPLVDLSSAKATIAEPGRLSEPEVRKSHEAATVRQNELRKRLGNSLKVLDETMAGFLTLTH